MVSVTSMRIRNLLSDSLDDLSLPLLLATSDTVVCVEVGEHTNYNSSIAWESVCRLVLFVGQGPHVFKDVFLKVMTHFARLIKGQSLCTIQDDGFQLTIHKMITM